MEGRRVNEKLVVWYGCLCAGKAPDIANMLIPFAGVSLVDIVNVRVAEEALGPQEMFVSSQQVLIGQG